MNLSLHLYVIKNGEYFHDDGLLMKIGIKLRNICVEQKYKI